MKILIPQFFKKIIFPENTHKVFGVISALFLLVISISGFGLGVKPFYYEMLYNDGVLPTLDNTDRVADVLETLLSQSPKINNIYAETRNLWVAKIDGGADRIINLDTMQLTEEFKPLDIFVFLEMLHTRLLLDDIGRVITVLSSICMIVLCVTGLRRLARKKNGLRNIFVETPADTMSKKIHSLLGFFSVIPLFFLGVTGAYTGIHSVFGVKHKTIMTGEMLESNPDYINDRITYAQMPALNNFIMADIKQVILPMGDDQYDVITVVTNTSTIYLDQYTGNVLSTESYGSLGRIEALMTWIHTTNDFWLWLMIWILGVLAVPVFVVTGIRFVMMRGKTAERVHIDSPDIMIFVGSEGGTTERFANALYNALINKNVGYASLNDIGRYAYVDCVKIILTSTYGDGDAPYNGTQAVSQINAFNGKMMGQYCIVGFGDKRYTNFCGFAKKLQSTLEFKKATFLLEPVYVNNSMMTVFQDWIQALSDVLSINISIELDDVYGDCSDFILQGKTVVKSERGNNILLQLSTAGLGTQSFVSGDVIAFVKNGILRYYSIANMQDGMVTICVRVLRNGFMSSHLDSMKIGDSITGFIHVNNHFHCPDTAKTVIMIGTGSGVTPLAGMIKNNTVGVAMHGIFGYASEMDNPYVDLFQKLQQNGQLSSLYYGYSITEKKRVDYVIKQNRDHINQLIRQRDCVFMVCGTLGVGVTVKSTLREILDADLVHVLDNPKTYLEDTY